jgi:hypothetical protein
MKASIVGGVLLALAGLSACRTQEDFARERCVGAADVAACIRADLARQREAEQRAMDDRSMGGNGGGMGY